MAFKVILKKNYGNQIANLYPDMPKEFTIPNLPTGDTITKNKFTIPLDVVLVMEDMS